MSHAVSANSHGLNRCRCGVWYVPKVPGRVGPRRRYCSTACQRAAYLERRPPATVHGRQEIGVCRCGAEFLRKPKPGPGPPRKHCSRACRIMARNGTPWTPQAAVCQLASCGATMPRGRQRNAKYCSSRCRQKAYRQRTTAGA